MMAFMEIPERLRREYLRKKEDAPLSENKGDFSLYGHRLSSLYRGLTLGEAWLIKRIQIGFSLSKILKSNANQKVLS
ncbi:MAG: hypothetical protein ACTSRN_04315 [Alphaproteobacteria bacterium]